MKIMKITAKDFDGKIRLSDFLKRKLGFSGALITKVKVGGVKLNGKTVTMRAEVERGDTVEITLPEEESENLTPISIPLDIVYEDEYILAVDKPREMPTHPSRGNSLPTLANAVAAYIKEPFVFRAINRLDRGTSGIVIIAKNAYSAARLGRAMKEGKFKKIYTALVEGIPEPKSGRICAPIKRESEDSLRRIVAPDGKEAITDYEVIKILPNGNSICRLTLHTGRTHQIRVHMAYIGHPLCGDFLYGKDSPEGYELRASEISFPHPESGDIITLKCKQK